ncbi:MAG: phosphate ABC transporter substrate-binding protein PstS [Chloroflexota bacterium]
MFTRLMAPLCAATVIASAVLTPAIAAPVRAGVSLTGAGSTFAFPFFDKAFKVYGSSHNLTVNYQPIGSGAGISQFTAKTVDFGATDVPMNPVSELPAAQKAGGPVEQIPVTLGGVSIAYNVPGLKTGLHLNGYVLGRIFLGVIKKWNDKEIRALNKNVKLPSMDIVAVHRSDGSGTSYIFTDYLSTVNAQWRGLVGTGKLPNWPSTGVGGKGNPGVAQLVEQTPGAIGYVELAYVLQNHMKQAMMQNKSKQYVFPTQTSVSSAAAAFPKVSATKFSIVNAPGKKSYPISGYTWLLVFDRQPDAAKGRALVQLMRWTVSTGQKYAKKLDYVALPKNVQSLGLRQLKRLH